MWMYYELYSSLVNRLEGLNYSYYDKIRILTDFILNMYDYEQIPNFINVKKLEEDDYYYIALELQKNIIKKINEKSNIFYPIIQFNSKILKLLPSDNLCNIFNQKLNSLFNKEMKEEFAFTISMEDIDDVKKHLFSLQEDFYFIFSSCNIKNLPGKYSYNNGITVINRYILFENIKRENLADKKETKNFAFLMNLAFCLERMGHHKEYLNKQSVDNPYIFFNKDFQRNYIPRDK